MALRTVSKLERVARNPLCHSSRPVGGDDCKLRIGEYRLLAMLSRETTTIVVERVDHLSRVYRRR